MTETSLDEFRPLDAADTLPIHVPPTPPKTTVLAVTIGAADTQPSICAVRYHAQLLTPGDPLFGEEPIFETHYTVLGSDELPADTSYPAVAARVNALARSLWMRDDRGDYHVLVDASDVGAPVVDAIRGSIIPQVIVTAVSVKPGDAGDLDLLWRFEATLGLAALISRMRAIVQGRRLHVPADQRALRQGLESYDIDTGGTALVRALALAVASEYLPVRYLQAPDTLPSARF